MMRAFEGPLHRFRSPFRGTIGCLPIFSVRNLVSCVFSKEKVDAEPQWVERRVANAKLWWYRSTKDCLPCPRGANCQDPKCKLLHPICLMKNCTDKYCRYSHPDRANPKLHESGQKVVVVGG